MKMLEERIKAGEIYIKDLFGDKYLFEIPNFQRAFAWEKENSELLFSDIKDALQLNQENGKKFDDYEPYFLGSIILWIKRLKDDGSGEYAVIDGQQRLVSLAILMAVMRDLTNDSDYGMDLQTSIYQKASKAKGTSEKVRIKVREKEEDFFKNHILKEDGTNVKGIDKSSLSEPKQHMVEAIEIFKNGFRNERETVDHTFLENYIKYLLQKVVLVVIKTSNLASAFRLFNIINARGMPLTNADLLKSESLSVLPKEEERKYTKIWEDIEEDLGSEKLEMLISFIRSMKLKEKARKSIFEEFDSKIFKKEPGFKGKNFIEYLHKVSQVYREKIEDAIINTERSEEETYYYNLISLMRDFLPFNDWMTAIIKFKERFNDDSRLFKFLKIFERKIVADWISGLSFTERLSRIYKVIRLIEDLGNPEDIFKNPMFDEEIKNNRGSFNNTLDDINFYGKGRTRVPKYILLRIDMERSYNQNKKIAYSGEITVEHILPRTPTDWYWLSRFNEDKRLKWTNKLGNLVLLNSRKNSQAGNKPFPQKVKDYFEKKSDFDITNELKTHQDWTLKELKERHEKLTEEAIKIWIG
jgi:uncharacterized protein with ParB-like and HNH nuclease domain